MKRIAFLILAFLFSCTAVAAIPSPSIDFVWDQEPIKAVKGKEVSTQIKLRMPEGCFVRADETDLEFVTLEGVEITEVEYPGEELRENPLGGKPLPAYISGEEIKIEMMVPDDMEEGEYVVSAVLHYQGCCQKVCDKPAEKLVSWILQVGEVSGGESLVDIEKLKETFFKYVDLIKEKLRKLF